MGIVGGLDVHRSQITFDWIDSDSGQSARGRISPANRIDVRRWFAQFEGRSAHFALESTTGWRFVVEEMHRVGIVAHLAEPADTAAMRGTKRRAKTDRADALLMRDLLMAGRLPESWIPPAHIMEMRGIVRLYKTLTDQRRGWCQRIQAILFHNGVPAVTDLETRQGRVALNGAELSEASRASLDAARRMVAAIDIERDALTKQINAFARHQAGCKMLMGFHGVGPIFATAILCELGDVTRFARSRQVVRHAGIDVTVYSSDQKRSPGHLSRQGPDLLRWALYEAAQQASRRTSPDHKYYAELKASIGHGRATLSIARLLVRRIYHALKPLGPIAMSEPVKNVA